MLFKVKYSEGAFYLGIFHLFLFVLTVTVPYHFYEYSEYSGLWNISKLDFGHNELQKLRFKIEAANNWTTNPIIQFITYFLSTQGMPFIWVGICLTLICYGEIDKRHQFFLKLISIFIACWVLTESHGYELIELVLK